MFFLKFMGDSSAGTDARPVRKKAKVGAYSVRPSRIRHLSAAQNRPEGRHADTPLLRLMGRSVVSYELIEKV